MNESQRLPITSNFVIPPILETAKTNTEFQQGSDNITVFSSENIYRPFPKAPPRKST